MGNAETTSKVTRSRLRRACAAVLTVTALGVTAAERQAESPALKYLAPQTISLDQAADKVRRIYGGRLLSINPVNRAGREGYEVRVLVEGGRVKTVFVDERGALSGK